MLLLIPKFYCCRLLLIVQDHVVTVKRLIHLGSPERSNFPILNKVLKFGRLNQPIFRTKAMAMQANSQSQRRASGSDGSVTLGQCQGVKTIGTHDGTFHCDEVLACVMLKMLPTYEFAGITRTRNEEILRTCTIVVDVGAVFDPQNLRFDHHQKSFNETMNSLRPEKPWTTRLSSAGLIYAHYGEEIISIILGTPVDPKHIQTIYDKVYENFIEEIDAVDNGIPQNDHPVRYRITTTLSKRVANLNPSWGSLRLGDNSTEEECFKKACELVRKEFLERVQYYALEWEAYEEVKEAVEKRFDVDPSGEIVELDVFCPWKDHLVALEKDLQIEIPIKFMIFPDGKGKWRVQGVPITPDSFLLRTPLHEPWRGLRGKELEDLSGIPTIEFVHATGFIGGAADRESVLEMARVTLQKSS